MTVDNVILAAVGATIVFVGVVGAYAWGYRQGVAYCVRELGPFKELLQHLKDSRKG